MFRCHALSLLCVVRCVVVVVVVAVCCVLFHVGYNPRRPFDIRLFVRVAVVVLTFCCCAACLFVGVGCWFVCPCPNPRVPINVCFSSTSYVCC